MKMPKQPNIGGLAGGRGEIKPQHALTPALRHINCPTA